MRRRLRDLVGTRIRICICGFFAVHLQPHVPVYLNLYPYLHRPFLELFASLLPLLSSTVASAKLCYSLIGFFFFFFLLFYYFLPGFRRHPLKGDHHRDDRFAALMMMQWRPAEESAIIVNHFGTFARNYKTHCGFWAVESGLGFGRRRVFTFDGQSHMKGVDASGATRV